MTTEVAAEQTSLIVCQRCSRWLSSEYIEEVEVDTGAVEQKTDGRRVAHLTQAKVCINRDACEEWVLRSLQARGKL